MVIAASHISPDGLLRLVVDHTDGDITVGFIGYEWHTHGDVLLESSGGRNIAQAVDDFVSGIVGSRRILAVRKLSGVIADVWPTDDPADDINGLRRYGAPDETIEFRLWDGTPIDG